MLLITDSHVSNGNAAEFFDMLDTIARTTREEVVFLGDIFDLWIALPRYETAIHRDFLDWCRRQKAVRTVGFVEGNHEFFLTQEHPECFTWCDPACWRDEHGHLFIHGDLVNRRDVNYFRFRKLTKGFLVKTLLRCLPFGPKIADAVKRRLKQRNNKFRKFMPEREIKNYADRCFNNDVQAILAGHFHQDYRYRDAENRPLYLIPDWQNTGQIARFHTQSRCLEILSWRELEG